MEVAGLIEGVLGSFDEGKCLILSDTQSDKTIFIKYNLVDDILKFIGDLNKMYSDHYRILDYLLITKLDDQYCLAISDGSETILVERHGDDLKLLKEWLELVGVQNRDING
jgi:hypothetical protein